MKAITLTLIPTIISAHSWAACTHYNTQDTNYLTLGKFDHSKCLGYPRAYDTQLSAELAQAWGIDTGYDWEHHKPDEQCRYSFDQSRYSDKTPMAIYYSGETIHISHPAKNHVADVCTNAFIPSMSMVLLMSSSPMSDTFDINVSMIGEDHQAGQIDHLGYQNCFEFCANQDKSHCITSWVVPMVTTSGRYSFKWRWEFNPHQYYSTCFDALILLQPNQSLINSTTNIPTPASSTPVVPMTSEPTSAPTTSEPTPASSTPVVPMTSEPTSAPTTSEPTTRMPITSDASQLTSIINDIFKSLRVTFNGTLNFTMFGDP